MQCLAKPHLKGKRSPIKSPPYVQDATSKDIFTPQRVHNMETRETRRRNKSYMQATTMGTIEEMAKQADFINPEAFNKASMDEKLLTMVTSLNKLHVKFDAMDEILHKKDEGLVPKMEALGTDVDDIAVEHDGIKFELEITKGLLHKQGLQIQQILEKLTDISARQMKDNLTITGLVEPQNGQGEEDNEEDCEAVVTTFLKEQLEIEAGSQQILVAHRIGEKTSSRDRPMVVRCHPKLRQKVLNKKKTLNKKTNSKGRPYYVNQQVPEALVAQQKELTYNIGKIKRANSKKAEQLRDTFKVKQGKLVVNGEPFEKVVKTPKVSELFAGKVEQDKMDRVKFWFSNPIEERGSVFTGVVTKTSSVAEVKRAYKKITQLYPSSTHIAMAYDCQRNGDGSEDDGEMGAGLCLKKLLDTHSATNKTVFMVRNLGGRKLGPRRFELMETVVKEALTKVCANSPKPGDT